MKTREERLYDWIDLQHDGQMRKGKSPEPYIKHLERVAAMAADYVRYGYEIGLCHDVLEDTAVTAKMLWGKLLEFGYDEEETENIVRAVHHLTAVYTSDHYPWMSRAQRKKLEASRLFTVRNADAITVKYCDLIDNVGAAADLDPQFARVYIPEKYELVQHLNQGDPALYRLALETVEAQIERLEE